MGFTPGKLSQDNGILIFVLCSEEKDGQNKKKNSFETSLKKHKTLTVFDNRKAVNDT